MPSMSLTAFNHLSVLAAGALMRSVCPSRSWAEKLTAARPFNNHNELLYTAHRAWWALPSEDWQEVFASQGSLFQRLESRALSEATPITDNPEQDQPISSSEAPTESVATEDLQAASESGANLLNESKSLAAAEHQYRQRFGFGFVTYVGSTTVGELLSLCRHRLANDPETEIRTAAEEQARINRIALEELFGLAE